VSQPMRSRGAEEGDSPGLPLQDRRVMKSGELVDPNRDSLQLACIASYRSQRPWSKDVW
jgi:hypothetical protein